MLQGEREMAAGNKTLGRFTLTGIPPAMRGMPQIEVKFDIDANGIVHVSAKDLGTGNAQQITLTASTNMKDSDVEAAVKEAEKYAAEDRKQKELVEQHNQADQMLHSVEKALQDLGDKVSADDRSKIQAEMENVKTIRQQPDVTAENIREALEKLTQASSSVFSEIYQQQAQQQQADQAGQADAPPQDDDPGTVDADYEVK